MAERIVLSLIFMFIFEGLCFPLPGLAAEYAENYDFAEVEQKLNITQESGLITDIAAFENSLPENNDLKVVRETYRTITAYNSEAAQCDSSPCITANGFDVCKHGLEDTIAANWLKFGTKVRIPELFGDRVFVVRDRMNERFSDKVDVWMVNKLDARKFGVKVAKIEVLGEP